jgi:hypothetical protein
MTVEFKSFSDEDESALMTALLLPKIIGSSFPGIIVNCRPFEIEYNDTSTLFSNSLASACSYAFRSPDFHFPVTEYKKDDKLESQKIEICDIKKYDFLKRIKELLGRERISLQQTLIEVWQESSSENWDNYGAKPITWETVFQSAKLISTLPTLIPDPDVVPEPAGEIGLEWYIDAEHRLSLGVNATPCLAYVARFGKDNRVFGTECFEREFPQLLLQLLKRIGYSIDYERVSNY